MPTNLPLSEHYTYPFITRKLSERLISLLPESRPQIIILCIGTDRSTGDSLGPLTGTLLEKTKPVHLKVYGTLHRPVHALNLEDHIKTIHDSYDKPFIVAIDASLGRLSSVGNITMSEGALLPGAAFNKKLPAVGHAHFTGVINMSGMMEFNVLQNTRLSLVYDMAKVLSRVLFQVEMQLEQTQRLKHFKPGTYRDMPSFKINGQYIK